MNPCTTYWRRNLRPSTPRFRSNDHAYRSVDVAARRSSRACVNFRPGGTRRSGSIRAMLAPRVPTTKPKHRAREHVVAVCASAPGRLHRAPPLPKGVLTPLTPSPCGRGGACATCAAETYCTATRDGRWTVSRSVTSRTRREWLQTMAAMGAGALVDGLFPRELAHAATGRVAQQQQDRLAQVRAQIGAIPIQAQPLAKNVTLFAGPGGNVVVLHGSDGLVVVDTFVAPAWPRLQESLKGLGGAPVKFVINTHWHFDHTDNNALLRAGGATVVAHENTRLRMTQPHHLAVYELDLPPSPAAPLPQLVFNHGYKLEANGERLAGTHRSPARTHRERSSPFGQ